ncbi:MAG TPA: serine hydrolase domain-containing protein [Oligoflexus sp.]|uniref:serine hydrolase domain-containing protein n=1 Tax=Oligoflexus sp. TaxID=1971216 RepID=UPI002D4E01F2|nr:serine hydrolase domain-containing protein [Oligoflexus sp.]HYX34099.1 serine hydrolase domain-containing protein [Oligoflexus sp.]
MRFIVLALASLVTSLPPSLAFSGKTPLADSLEAYTKNQGPALGILVVRNGQIVRKDAFGFETRESKVKATTKTNFNLASNSKQFTAFAVMLLEKAGKIAPQDPVGKFIPDWPQYAKDVQIKHLISHTSGLPDYISELCLSGKKVANKDVLALLRSKAALDFAAGTQHEYSNTGYVILAEVVEQVTRRPFYAFIQDNIFDKLGMVNSKVLRADAHDKVNHRATSYTEWPFFEPKYSIGCDLVYGDGGVLTNLDDYAHWMTALTQPGMLDQASIDRLFMAGSTRDGKPIAYGYGWALQEVQGKRLIIHDGAWLAFRSIVGYWPEQKLWVAVLSAYSAAPIKNIFNELSSAYMQASQRPVLETK